MIRIWATIAISFATAFAIPAAAQTPVQHAVQVDLSPTQSHMSVTDTITLTGTGETVFTLPARFTVDALTIDARRQPRQRQNDTLTVDLGPPGRHTVILRYRAQGQPLPGRDGGLIDGSWLAQAPHAETTWVIEGKISPGQKFILPGRLISERTTADGYRATFESTTPDTAPTLITGPFEVREKWLGKIRLRTYFHPELAPLADVYLADTARYLRTYIDQIGAYPYEQFAIVSGPDAVGWGLAGLTYIGRKVLALPFIRSTSLPHEILHNWWGNAVRVDYARGNWAEGLTTYLTDFTRGQEVRRQWLRDYAALPAIRDQPLSSFRAKTHDGAQIIGYGKSAFVFHMLKVRWGAAVFQRAIRRFQRDNAWKIAGWADIQGAFESETGQDLSAFFDPWITRTGAPQLSLFDATRVANRVTFSVAQVQPGAAYPLDLNVKIDTALGRQRRTVRLTKKSQRFTLVLPEPATALRVDPDADIFRRLNRTEMPPIVRDITLNPRTQLVALGAAQMRPLAQRLADTLTQSEVPQSPPSLAITETTPVILVGPPRSVRDFLKANGWSAPRAEMRPRGDARAWVQRSQNGRAVLAVEVSSPSALEAMIRVLPHYKRRSFVIMEKGQTIAKGTWPVANGPGSEAADPLSVRF